MLKMSFEPHTREQAQSIISGLKKSMAGEIAEGHRLIVQGPFDREVILFCKDIQVYERACRCVADVVGEW